MHCHETSHENRATYLDDVLKVKLLYKLKEVDRWAPVLKRKEASAEHTYSSLILADYFLGKVKRKLDRSLVFDLLLYHDVVEIETGDVGLLDKANRVDKKEKELKAARKIMRLLPSKEGKKFYRLFLEYENGTSNEAKFARAIDRLDAMIHMLDYKELYSQFSEQDIRDYNEKRLSDFPEILALFEELLVWLRKKKYIRS